MAQQKKNFITRLLEGKEKSEEYARSTLPTNRWQLFFDIFKGNFGKLVKVNILTLLFFIPMIAVIVISMFISEYLSTTSPFSGQLGLGYTGFYGFIQGQAELNTLATNFFTLLGVLLTAPIAAVGIAGGMYVIRNMVWTEGIFVANDFWRGVKLNFKNALQTSLIMCGVLFLCLSAISLSEWSIAIGQLAKWETVMLRISQGVSIIFIVLLVMMSLWMLALSVNYNMTFLSLFRNSFLMTIGTLPQTIFFGAIALVPYVLFFFKQPLVLVIGCLLVIFIAFSYTLLVWLDFAQWVFDKYINPKIEGAKVGRGIYNKDGTSALTGNDSGASIEYQRIILSHGRSRLVARPIKPIDDSLQVYELPQSFTREDLKRLRESKQQIAEDSEAYAEEHKNDLRYVEYNRQFDEREKALQEEDEKKNKKRRGKKLKPPKMLNEQ